MFKRVKQNKIKKLNGAIDIKLKKKKLNLKINEKKSR